MPKLKQPAPAEGNRSRGTRRGAAFKAENRLAAATEKPWRGELQRLYAQAVERGHDPTHIGRRVLLKAENIYEQLYERWIEQWAVPDGMDAPVLTPEQIAAREAATDRLMDVADRIILMSATVSRWFKRPLDLPERQADPPPSPLPNNAPLVPEVESPEMQRARRVIEETFNRPMIVEDATVVEEKKE